MLFDILSPTTSSPKAQRVSRALLEGGGPDVRLMREYKPRPGAALVVYGPGGPDRYPHVKAHPGPLVCWDLGYWDRKLDDGDRKFRVSIGGFHPKGIMDGPSPSPDRWSVARLSITQAKCKGPILLIGNSPKSVAVGAEKWTAKKSRDLRRLFPVERISYRPKPGRGQERSVECDHVSGGLIEDALARCSLVVCRHSNVAVDACRMGVPVVCDDGAAAAIYPSRLEDRAEQPSAERRLEFLHRLAWWQWSTREMESGQAWEWLRERMQ